MRTLILLLCLSFATARAQEWTPIPLGTSADLYAIENTYLSPHWVVGAGGFAARSNNDRSQWVRQDLQTQAALYSVQEPTGSEVYMGAGQGVVRLRVYQFLFERDLPSQSDFRLFTREGAHVVAVGPGGLIFKTTNAGNDWIAQESGTTANLNGGAGRPSGPAWIAGQYGTILKTTDGNTWAPMQTGTTADLYAIAERNFTDIYAVGQHGTILKSTDAGVTWSLRPSGTTATLRAVSISKTSDTHLIVAGKAGVVLKSTDAGDTWLPCEVTTTDLYGAEAISDTEFYVAGAAGLLLHTTNGGGPCLDPTAVGQEDPRSATVRLDGPYPQPSTGISTLRLRVDAGRLLRTEVFDAGGRVVLSLPETQVTGAGDHEISLDTRGWAAGVYLVRVKGEGLDEARRLVVTR